MFNLGTVIGPAAGGLVYAAVGPGWCFLINGITFIASLTSLALIRVHAIAPVAGNGSTKTQLIEGLHFAWRHPQIRYLIISMGMLGKFVFGCLSLLPAWARDVLQGDSTTFGLLNSARGLGSLIAALIVASISHMDIRGRIWFGGILAAPIFMMLFASFRWLPMAMLMLVGIGLAVISQGNNSNALIQLNVPDHLRGRVMGIFMLVFNGGLPIGALAAGVAAEAIGASATISLAGGVLLIFAVYTWFSQPGIRKMG
jgi:predicted MFS family arabinose efflux permease